MRQILYFCIDLAVVPLVWIELTPFFLDSLSQNDWIGKERQGAKKNIFSDVAF